MELSHLSASSLKTWKTCKLQWYAEKVLDIDRRPAHPLTRVGSAVHEAFELSMEDRDTLSHLPEAYAKYDLHESDLQERAENMTKTCIEWGWWDGVDQLDSCIAEQEFLIEAGSGVKLKGFIDRLDIKGNHASVLDIKTQARKFTKDELRNNLQASIYNIAARRLNPNVVGPIRVEFWVLRHEIQAVTKTQADADRETELMKQEGLTIMAHDESVWPEPSSGPHCKWCDFIDKCPDWVN
tara:strand:- start:2961 stop:3677 length:717 start_codon:yes stop_codon:yes gene_type:complete